DMIQAIDSDMVVVHQDGTKDYVEMEGMEDMPIPNPINASTSVENETPDQDTHAVDVESQFFS
ncbi:MAG: hypothetical protein RR366_09465, partial [Clostridium sp.]